MNFDDLIYDYAIHDFVFFISRHSLQKRKMYTLLEYWLI